VVDNGHEDLYDVITTLDILKKYSGNAEVLKLIQNNMYPLHEEIDLAKRGGNHFLDAAAH